MWRNEITTGLHAALGAFWGPVFLFSESFSLSVCAQQEVTDMRRGPGRQLVYRQLSSSLGCSHPAHLPGVRLKRSKDPADDQPVPADFRVEPFYAKAAARGQPEHANVLLLVRRLQRQICSACMRRAGLRVGDMHFRTVGLQRSVVSIPA